MLTVSKPYPILIAIPFQLRHRCDRTFVDNNERWIIDYKYAAPMANESEQSFCQRQIESYKPQLDHYAQLYQKLDNKKCDVRSIFCKQRIH